MYRYLEMLQKRTSFYSKIHKTLSDKIKTSQSSHTSSTHKKLYVHLAQDIVFHYTYIHLHLSFFSTYHLYTSLKMSGEVYHLVKVLLIVTKLFF